ncbi:type III restriction enzyme [Coprinopsis marcescibilis]|uniref:Type III restriction enzyme n=1 Tax=Coprinopsis marcescibilis TaxID=230819 RepID=A0A5C3KYS5_COPMA|nr:type III restriction enzyme [Coprinopsis marcescibilis]
MTITTNDTAASGNVVANPGQVARKYQEEIFRQAQKANVIAYLRTGLGKTLISVLLIRWMCTQEKARDKAIFFLVPKVSLVEQQANYIHKETGLRTCRLHGALSLDFGNRRAWNKRFQEHDVFVITPQLFMEMITHSVWSIDKCSLIIFDECHHARKNHPYNNIMREYFEVQPTKARPKIFGMTASPYWNQKNPALSLSTLETNLDSKIIGVHEHVEELQNHYARLNEVIQDYPYPPERYEFPEPTLFQCLKIFQANDPSLFDHMDVTWSKVEMRYYMTLNNIGPYGASLYLFTEMQHYVNELLSKAQRILSTDTQHNAMSIDVDATSTQPLKLPPIAIFDILEVLDDFEPYYYSLASPDTLPVPVPLEWCTPKLQILVHTVKDHLKQSVQTIIFVEQRQIAACLAKVLEAIPELQGLVRCGYLVGLGTSGAGISKRIESSKGDVIKLFRDKEINVLIATSVAEEGLDFPACELVIRFDPLQHLVGYVQSRGRARSEVSKYIIMIQQDNIAQLERYRSLQRGETELSQTYNTRQLILEEEGEELEIDPLGQDIHPIDLAERERYVVPSTGAILTYDNAMSLINHLCSIIPRDAFTLPPKPVYSGQFQSKLRLPAGLPLRGRDMVYLGYPKRTKKEAKRSAAFQAVKRLMRLNVFDEYLLPTSKDVEDIEEGEQRQAELPSETLQVQVKDPWYMGTKLWLHPLRINSDVTTAIVTGTDLPTIDMKINGFDVSLEPGIPLDLCPEDELEKIRLMNDFTNFGVWLRNTSKPFEGKMSFFLVPLTDDAEIAIDFDFMHYAVENKRGTRDWSGVDKEDYGQVLVFNRNQFGRTYRLECIRNDLSMQSTPEPGTKESTEGTYYEFFSKRWTRKKRFAFIPNDGPLLEATILFRADAGTYNVRTGEAGAITHGPAEHHLIPLGCCQYLHFPKHLCNAFGILPALCHAVTGLYRAQMAQTSLHLPAIAGALLTEALTIPAAQFCFNNQRLETLGDAVLKLLTTVHLLNAYPTRHEGQLSDLRKQYVSNNFLLRRALDVQLERYISCEVSSVNKWRYVLPESKDLISDQQNRRCTTAVYPRRSLQDCMEALLGASFLEGGTVMALQAGTALGVLFGGPLPWNIRYRRSNTYVPVTPLFDTLQDRLGYEFRSNDLLVEAVTHPSFAGSSNGPSYQRLEFLGDAILDLVVMHYLFNKFPDATSHQLSFLRAKVICSPALAYLSAKKLSLHKILLVNNVELYRAIDMYVPVLDAISDEEIVSHGWKYDPPKAISDVFESLIGAVFVDSGYDYERVSVLVEDVMGGVLEHLALSLAKDPISEFTEWMAKEGCKQKVVFKKHVKPQRDLTGFGLIVQVHDIVVVGPIIASTQNVAKFIASQRAFSLVSDPESEFSLDKICNCGKQMDVDGIKETPSQVTDSTVIEVSEPEEKIQQNGGVLEAIIAM